jgi:hypothetical protein
MREIGATVQLHLINGYKSRSIELHLQVQLGETGAINKEGDNNKTP